MVDKLTMPTIHAVDEAIGIFSSLGQKAARIYLSPDVYRAFFNEVFANMAPPSPHQIAQLRYRGAIVSHTIASDPDRVVSNDGRAVPISLSPPAQDPR